MSATDEAQAGAVTLRAGAHCALPPSPPSPDGRPGCHTGLSPGPRMAWTPAGPGTVSHAGRVDCTNLRANN